MRAAETMVAFVAFCSSACGYTLRASAGPNVAAAGVGVQAMVTIGAHLHIFERPTQHLTVTGALGASSRTDQAAVAAVGVDWVRPWTRMQTRVGVELTAGSGDTSDGVDRVGAIGARIAGLYALTSRMGESTSKDPISSMLVGSHQAGVATYDARASVGLEGSAAYVYSGPSDEQGVVGYLGLALQYDVFAR